VKSPFQILPQQRDARRVGRVGDDREASARHSRPRWGTTMACWSPSSSTCGGTGKQRGQYTCGRSPGNDHTELDYIRERVRSRCTPSPYSPRASVARDASISSPGAVCPLQAKNPKEDISDGNQGGHLCCKARRIEPTACLLLSETSIFESHNTISVIPRGSCELQHGSIPEAFDVPDPSPGAHHGFLFLPAPRRRPRG
jgi:hypothetical protein